MITRRRRRSGTGPPATALIAWHGADAGGALLSDTELCEQRGRAAGSVAALGSAVLGPLGRSSRTRDLAAGVALVCGALVVTGVGAGDGTLPAHLGPPVHRPAEGLALSGPANTPPPVASRGIDRAALDTTTLQVQPAVHGTTVARPGAAANAVGAPGAAPEQQQAPPAGDADQPGGSEAPAQPEPAPPPSDSPESPPQQEERPIVTLPAPLERVMTPVNRSLRPLAPVVHQVTQPVNDVLHPVNEVLQPVNGDVMPPMQPRQPSPPPVDDAMQPALTMIPPELS